MWFQARLKVLDQSQAALARHLGLNSSAVSRMFKGERRMKADEAPAIATFLECTVNDVLDHARTSSSENAVVSLRKPVDERLGAEVDLSKFEAARLGEKNLPVYASAEGGPTGLIVTPEPIDWVKRPEPLLNVARGFAVYVIGDSMSPAYNHGDMILVHPSKPPQRGDDVLLTKLLEDRAMAALVKKLVRWNESTWFVKQYNPPKEFKLARSEWQQVNVIVGKYNAR